jgi:hypothetical protein
LWLGQQGGHAPVLSISASGGLLVALPHPKSSAWARIHAACASALCSCVAGPRGGAVADMPAACERALHLSTIKLASTFRV